MKARPVLLLPLLLLVVVSPCASESVRETEVMDPQDFYDTRYYSGALPDDEDVGKTWLDRDSHPEDFELSGSGDEEYTELEEKTYLTEKPETTMDNRIPDEESRNQDPEDPKVVEGNEIPLEESPALEGGDVSNKVAMASATHESIFERTEVLAALIAGGIVGLLFAVFLILLLVYRMKKKDEGSYDLGKKPIYKKAPTTEFFA
ncbi:syndecan-4 [Tachyglossus aculeatus]|uniref:syndecan-4 n=1 Tax=Tachyglossus aculeatus TaxID=9261 RepID=UPI0018F5F07F|nr:syndecan-4 [Tachyglossus aculeatus]